jgi:hypothetical protein
MFSLFRCVWFRGGLSFRAVKPGFGIVRRVLLLQTRYGVPEDVGVT